MNSVIIVAAGAGKRMGANIPKQFITIQGITILEHTLKGFLRSKLFGEFVIVLASDFLAEGAALQAAYPTRNIKICTGGKERFHSVKNALEAISLSCETIFIHDAVRPFFSQSLLENSLASCQQYGNAIPATPLTDSIRKMENGKSEALDRSLLKSIQTPQVFNYKKLREAYTQDFSALFTDDASVYEQAGNTINLCEGEVENIKITTPSDLEWATYKVINT